MNTPKHGNYVRYVMQQINLQKERSLRLFRQITRLQIEDVKSQLTRTKKMIKTELKTTNIGMRGPGGIFKGLHGYEDH